MARYIWHDTTCVLCGKAIKSGNRVRDCTGGVRHQGNCPEVVRPEYSSRQIVRIGSVAVGSTINGLRVVSLGKSWIADNEDNSAYGVHPSEAAHVQYAYLAEV